MTHGRYRTEGGARRSAKFIAVQSSTPFATAISNSPVMGFPRATEQRQQCNRARVDPLTKHERPC
jgi:hypothetical protein